MSEIEQESIFAQGQGKWTCESNPAAGHLWYFELAERRSPPYLKQILVDAIIDVADDGTVAGIEIIDTKMPGPPKS